MAERTFGPCDKCAGTDIHVRYHEGRRHCSDCRDIASCRYSATCGRDGKKGEHLVVHCRRCGYGWLEQTA